MVPESLFKTPALNDAGVFTWPWVSFFNSIFSGSFSDNETPSGLINGANKIFALARTPNPLVNLQLFKNGILQIQGVDYTLNRNVATFSAAPVALSTLKAFYRY